MALRQLKIHQVKKTWIRNAREKSEIKTDSAVLTSKYYLISIFLKKGYI